MLGIRRLPACLARPPDTASAHRPSQAPPTTSMPACASPPNPQAPRPPLTLLRHIFIIIAMRRLWWSVARKAWRRGWAWVLLWVWVEEGAGAESP